MRLLVFMAALLLVGCASEPTVASYARQCAEPVRGYDFEEFLKDGEFTWAEQLSMMSANLAAAEELSPPPVLTDYHEAALAVFRAQVELADSQPPDEPFNPAMTLSLVEHTAAWLETIPALPDDVTNVMVEEGCLDPRVFNEFQKAR